MKNWLLSLMVAVGLAGSATAGVDTVNSDVAWSRMTSTSFTASTVPGAQKTFNWTFSNTGDPNAVAYKVQYEVVTYAASATCFNANGWLLVSLTTSTSGGNTNLNWQPFGLAKRDTGYGEFVSYDPLTGHVSVYIMPPDVHTNAPDGSCAASGDSVSVIRITIWRGRRVNVSTTTTSSGRPAGADLLAGSVSPSSAG